MRLVTLILQCIVTASHCAFGIWWIVTFYGSDECNYRRGKDTYQDYLNDLMSNRNFGNPEFAFFDDYSNWVHSGISAWQCATIKVMTITLSYAFLIALQAHLMILAKEFWIRSKNQDLNQVKKEADDSDESAATVSLKIN